MKAIAAIYKEGVFKPLEKVGLEEDAKVVIRVERSIVDKSGIILAKEPKFFTDMLRGLLKSGINAIATNDPDFERAEEGIKVWVP